MGTGNPANPAYACRTSIGEAGKQLLRPYKQIQKPEGLPHLHE